MRQKAIRGLALILALLATPLAAHQLNVFAFVEGTDVVVETKFSSGRVPTSGDVQVFDASDVLLGTLALSGDGTLRFPLDPVVAEGGLRIEVTVGDHGDYWLLTPQDIAAGLGQ